MIDSPGWLAEKLAAEGDRTAEFFGGLKTQDWNAMVYTDGADWQVRDILAHFVATELSISELIRHILSGGPGVAEDFDLNGFNESKVAAMQTLSGEHLLAQFAQARQQTAALVGGLSEQDLQKTGRHPFLGVAPVLEIIKLMYRHNQIHQRDIRRTIPGQG